MRRIYSETGALTPAEKIGNWVFDRLWRLMFVFLFAALFCFSVTWVVDFANFVQSGGKFEGKFYDPDPTIILTIRILGSSVIGFFIVHKRV